MATNVVMPQMGESIAEGTIVRWIKKVGERVDRDEPLFEISTDKVDAEIPSPGAGVLTEIRVKEGETVPVNAVVAVIGGPAEKVASPGSEMPAAAVGQPSASARADVHAGSGETSPTPRSGEGREAGSREPSASPRADVHAGSGEAESRPTSAASTSAPGGATADRNAATTDKDAATADKQRTSPLVRRIARDHNVDISRITGTGISGRVTKSDILGFIESPSLAASTSAPAGASVDKGAETQGKAQTAPAPAPGTDAPTFKPAERVEIVPMTIMRRKIAEHMVLSAHTSAHVYSVYEVDFHRLSELRDAKKADYERNGAKLSFTALIAKATVDSIRAFPFTNASIDGDNVVYKKDINLGIAVALDQGLIVPVIRNADERNLLGLSRAIDDLATRARSKKLNPDDVQGGTFTITNPGIFGAVYGLPLINQPQVAILGVGLIEKRAVVINDAIAIHPTCHISLGYDHRLIDGADAGRFLTDLKQRLEHFDESWM
jgi:2-oxoglutarate dehydrogenase E2 component (dihydrolipoamide succinyltransferase)